MGVSLAKWVCPQQFLKMEANQCCKMKVKKIHRRSGIQDLRIWELRVGCDCCAFDSRDPLQPTRKSEINHIVVADVNRSIVPPFFDVEIKVKR